MLKDSFIYLHEQWSE